VSELGFLPTSASSPFTPTRSQKEPEAAQTEAGHSSRLHKKQAAILEHTDNQSADQADDRPADQDKHIFRFLAARQFAFGG
jgi:hypothetical protein